MVFPGLKKPFFRHVPLLVPIIVLRMLANWYLYLHFTTWEIFPTEKIAIAMGNNYLKTSFLANANVPSDILLSLKIFLCWSADGSGERSYATQMLTDRYKQLKSSVTSMVIASRTIAHALNCSDKWVKQTFWSNGVSSVPCDFNPSWQSSQKCR